MSKKKDEKIKVVIMNPERLPAAKQKLMEFLYEEYKRSKNAEA